MEATTQERHESLVKFLSQFSQYQNEDGSTTLKIQPKPLSSDKISFISTNDINKAVVVFTDVLNIASGSAGDYDFYKLMQAYITVPEFRAKFNVLSREALAL